MAASGLWSGPLAHKQAGGRVWSLFFAFDGWSPLRWSIACAGMMGTTPLFTAAMTDSLNVVVLGTSEIDRGTGCEGTSLSGLMEALGTPRKGQLSSRGSLWQEGKGGSGAG